MKYFVNNDENYIISISTGAGDKEITEKEYNELLQMIRTKPVKSEKGYRLTLKKDWEEYDLIPVPIDEAPSADERLAAIEDAIASYKNDLATVKGSITKLQNELKEVKNNG